MKWYWGVLSILLKFGGNPALKMGGSQGSSTVEIALRK